MYVLREIGSAGDWICGRLREIGSVAMDSSGFEFGSGWSGSGSGWFGSGSGWFGSASGWFGSGSGSHERGSLRRSAKLVTL